MARTYLIDGEKSIELDNLQRWEQFGNVPWRDESMGTQRYYASVPLVYRAVDIRANALAGLPWAILRGETDVWDSETPAPPAEIALLGDLPDWLWGIEAGLCLTATAYLYKLRNRVRITGLRRLDPTIVEPVLDLHYGITGWRRNWPGSEIPQHLALDDVVAIWLKGLGEVSPRVPPAQAAMSAAGASYNLQSFVAGYFRRGAIKATLLTVEGQPSEPERKRLRAWWERVVGGVRNAFGAEVISASVKPVVIGEGLKELSNTELTKSLREDVATAFGIPHSLVMSNAANFATAQQDELNFYNTTILPEAKQIQRQLNAQLFEPLGLRFEFRPGELSVFQTDENERADAYGKYVAAGMKPSVAAQVLGVDLPQGVEYADLDAKEGSGLAEGSGQMGAERAGDASASASAPTAYLPSAQSPLERAAEVRRFRAWAKRRAHAEPAKFASTLLSDGEKRAILETLRGEAATTPPPFAGSVIPKQVKLVLQLDPDDDEAEQRIREELERKGERELTQALRAQLDELLPSDADEETVRRSPGQVAQTAGRVRDVLRRILQQSADLGVSSAVAGLDAVGIGFDWTLANQDAAEWVRQYTFDLVQGIQQTTQARMQQAVTEWINNGEDLPALIRELEPLFGRERAKLVAITEVTRAYQQGSELAWKRSGVVEEMEWVTVRDEAVCPRCGPLHGKRTSLALPDFDGLAGPPAHPRCRCFTRPRVKEPARQDTRDTDLPTQIARLTGRKEVLPLGELRGGAAETVRRHWPDMTTNQVVLTGERRAHYLARHPEMARYEQDLPSVLFEPDEIHRNAQDPRIGIWYRKADRGRYLRAVVWVSGREDLQNSVHSFRLAEGQEVQQGRRRGRALWEK